MVQGSLLSSQSGISLLLPSCEGAEALRIACVFQAFPMGSRFLFQLPFWCLMLSMLRPLQGMHLLFTGFRLSFAYRLNGVVLGWTSVPSGVASAFLHMYSCPGRADVLVSVQMFPGFLRYAHGSTVITSLRNSDRVRCVKARWSVCSYTVITSSLVLM